MASERDGGRGFLGFVQLPLPSGKLPAFYFPFLSADQNRNEISICMASRSLAATF